MKLKDLRTHLDKDLLQASVKALLEKGQTADQIAEHLGGLIDGLIPANLVTGPIGVLLELADGPLAILILRPVVRKIVSKLQEASTPPG